MDAHHRRIFRLVNRLVQERDRHSDRETVAEAIGEMIKYSSDHLTAEESMLREIDFPGLDGHVQLHKAFRSSVGTMVLRSLESDPPSLGEVLEFLHNWWTNHILVEDMKYRDLALTSRGESP